MSRAVLNRQVHMTTREVAAHMGVSLRAVQLWCEQGIIPYGRTPGRHRRMQVAHVQLLAKHMADNLPLPTAGQYAVAVLVANASPDEQVQAAVRQQKFLDFAVMAENSRWLLEQHQEMRIAVGAPPLRTDEDGLLVHALDVVAHEAFRKGVMFAHSWLSAPTVTGEAE